MKSLSLLVAALWAVVWSPVVSAKPISFDLQVMSVLVA